MIVTMSGFTVGQAHANARERQLQWTYSARDQLTYSRNAKGAHALKVGGTVLCMPTSVFICNKCMGQLNVNVSPSAFTQQTGINFASLFPGDSTNQGSWNLAPLSRFVTSYVVGLGQMQVYSPMILASGWVQDDWRIGTKLTVNLGLPLRHRDRHLGRESGHSTVAAVRPAHPEERDRATARFA